jgi:pyruvate,water dikinase
MPVPLEHLDPPDAAAATELRGALASASRVGGKANALDRLIAWGFPVPPSGVVTTDVYLRVAASVEVSELIAAIRTGRSVPADEVDQRFLGARLNESDARRITELARAVGGGRRLAVRSSATVEDLAGSSFAGQYRTLLDVDSTDGDEVLRAVRLVFASLWHPAPVAYRAALGVDDADAAMAALIMQMVPVQTAGVVFTRAPGSTLDLARVEVVEGLGEQLVSGAVTPGVYMIDRSHPEPIRSDIDGAVRLSLETEQRFGCPQDVEWAWDGSTTWLVQARPITALDVEDGDGFDSDPTDHELTTAGIGEMVPGVLPPLIAQINLHLLEEAFRRLLDDLGTPPDAFPSAPVVHRVRGRAALDFDVLRDMAVRLPGGSADELEFQYFGSRRQGRRTAPPNPDRGWRGRVRAAMHDIRVLRARRWAAQSAEIVMRATEELDLGAPLTEIDTPALLRLRSRVIDLATRGMAAELGVAAVAASSFRKLELMLEPHLGPDRATAAAERVTSGHGIVPVRHAGGSASVFAGPTFDELGLVPADFAAPPSADLEDRFGELAGRLGGLRSWSSNPAMRYIRGRGLAQLVDDTVSQLRRREAAKSSILALGGLVRSIHLELGRRLVAHGTLGDALDVDLLRDTELRDVLEGVRPPTTLGARRRWVDRYVSEGPLPARFTGRPERVAANLPEGDQLEGWATSAGRVDGIARVISSPSEGLEPGSILVAEATDASWSPLFVNAAGIVLERGGPLSHAAILARELGIPAVLNVKGATRLLDGASVTVDGDAGVVVVRRP